MHEQNRQCCYILSEWGRTLMYIIAHIITYKITNEIKPNVLLQEKA
jgi:hypothetical protein